MALWDIVKGVGSVVGQSVVNTANEAQKSKDKWSAKYERMSDEEIKREYENIKSHGMSGSTAEKAGRMTAFKAECKARGFIKE